MFAKMCQKTVGQKSTKNICKSVLKHCKSAPKMFGKVRQKDSLAKVHQKCLQKCAKKYNYEMRMTFSVQNQVQCIWGFTYLQKCLQKCAKVL